MKKKLLAGVLVGAVTALMGIQATTVAAQASQLWSVVVHLAYADGTSYDYVMQRGVSTEDMRSILQDCGRSHWTGSVIRYHCYPVPE